MISVCLFDFDYTLGDSTNGIVESVNFALSNMLFPPREREEIRYTIGMSLPETFTYLTGNTEERQGEEFTKWFREKADQVMTENTELLPDSAEVLSRLKSKGIRTGIVTSKYHYRISEILSKRSIRHLVDIIVGREDVTHAKPHPEALVTAMEKLGAHRENTLYVGDSTIDAKTAQSAHVGFIAVTTGTTKEEEFSHFPHAAVIRSLSELMELVGAAERENAE